MAKAPKKIAAPKVPAARQAKPAAVAIAPAAVEPDKQYRIKITRPVKVGNTVLRPWHDNIVKGKHIAGMGDAVTSIEQF